MIKQAVPPGGDLCIALGQVEACDLPKRGRLGCAIFGSGGLRSRVPRTFIKQSKSQHKHLQLTYSLAYSLVRVFVSKSESIRKVVFFYGTFNLLRCMDVDNDQFLYRQQ